MTLLQFEHIQNLFGLLVLIPLVTMFVGVLIWKRHTRKAFGDERLVSQLTSGYSHKLYKLKIILSLVALALCIISLANLRQPKESEKGVGYGVDVMIMVDVSKSMLSQDVRPSRLDKAKQFINTLLANLQNNRVGLILFAGQAYLQMPLTPDVSAARMFVANASPDAVPVQGTIFSEALALCNKSMNVKEQKFKAAVLISDGEDQDANAEAVAKELYEKGVVVHAVGIGSPEGSFILEPGTEEPKKDLEGNVIVSKLNEELLQKIASTTKGSYSRLENVSQTAAIIASQINNMEKKGFEAGAEIEYELYFPFILGLAVLLLLAENFIPERKKAIA